MIARLRGKVIEAYPNRLVVDVQGVGYEVHVPLSTFDHLHPSEGAVVKGAGPVATPPRPI